MIQNFKKSITRNVMSLVKVADYSGHQNTKIQHVFGLLEGRESQLFIICLAKCIEIESHSLHAHYSLIYAHRLYTSRSNFFASIFHQSKHFFFLCQLLHLVSAIRRKGFLSDIYYVVVRILPSCHCHACRKKKKPKSAVEVFATLCSQ